MIKAEIIADSLNAHGNRMRTFKLRYPWFIHGELMTHRMLSKNASSNRAIPLAKMLTEVLSDDLRAEPVYWGVEQTGMEPGGELSDEPNGHLTGWLYKSPRDKARTLWREAGLAAANQAARLGDLGLHKSLCNRLLMPFTHANVVISGTEWDNFFGLRLDKAADPTMRALAVAIWEAQQKSVPALLQPGQWHLPFVERSDWEKYLDHLNSQEGTDCTSWITMTCSRC